MFWSHLFPKTLKGLLPYMSAFSWHPVILDIAGSQTTPSNLPVSSFAVCLSLSLVSYKILAIIFRIHSYNPEWPHVLVRTSANTLLPNKVTFIGPEDWNVDICFGELPFQDTIACICYMNEIIQRDQRRETNLNLCLEKLQCLFGLLYRKPLCDNHIHWLKIPWEAAITIN